MPNFSYEEESILPETPEPPAGLETRATVGKAAGLRDAAAVVGGVIFDLPDSVLASVTKLTPLPDFERGTISKQIPFVKENLRAAEAASGIVGLIAESIAVPELTALKGFDTLVKGNKVLKAISASDAMVEQALKRVRTLDRFAAEEGLQGVDALRSTIDVAGLKVKRDAIANAARRTALKRTLTQGVATEAVIATTLYENEFVTPDHAPTTMAAFAALGIALPAGFDQIAIGAQMRRALQSDAVRLARMKALDAGSGVEDIKAEASKKAFGKAPAVPKVEHGDLRFVGQFSDEAALEALQLHARETPTGRPVLDTNKKEAALGNLQLAQEALTKVTARGIRGAMGSQFSMVGKDLGSAERQTILDLLRQDPVALQGFEELGRIPEDSTIDDLLIQRDRFLDAKEEKAYATLIDEKAAPELKAKASATIDQVGFAREFVPVIIDRGEVHPAAHYANRGKPFDGKISTKTLQFDPNAVKPAGGKKAFNIFTADQTGISMASSNAKLTLPPGKTIATLDYTEAQSIYALGRKFIKESTTGRRLEVNANASFYDLDLAETLLREKPHDVTVVFPEGMDRQSAMVESLAQKADILRRHAGDIQADDLPMWREKLNLPGLTELQRAEFGVGGKTPTETLLFGGLTGKDIRSMSLSDLQKAAAEARRKTGTLVAVGPDELDVLGTSFITEGSPFVRSGDRPNVRPVLGFKRDLGNTIFDRGAIENRRAETLAESLSSLVNGNATTTMSDLARTLLADLDANTITDLSRLDDTLQVASIGNDRIRRGIFSNQTMAAAGNKTLLAAQRIFRKTSAFIEKDYDNFLRTQPVGKTGRTIQDVIGAIQRSENTKSRLLVEQFAQARRGFQLTGNLIRKPDGFFEFELRNVQANRRQYELLTGRPMPKSKATLPLTNGKPLGVDQMALETIGAFDAISNKLRADQNTILRAAGVREIKREPFYLPPQIGKFNSFILDANDVPVRMITADTAEQRQHMIQALRNDKDSVLNRTPGAHVKDQEQIELATPLLGKAQNDFLDPSIPYVQALNQGRSGAGASPFTVGRSVSDIMKSYRNLMNANTRRILEVIFQPQLNEARVRAVTSVSKSKGGSLNRFSGEPDAPSTAAAFMNNLLGRRELDTATSIVGRITTPLEGLFNVGLRNSYSAWTAVGGRNLEPGQLRKEFDEAVKQLGPRTPFSSGAAVLEERNLFKTPPDIAAVSHVFNDIATRLMLRYDVAHAVINMAGIITTFPAVAANLLPRAGESYIEVASRLGRDSDVFVSSNGKSFTSFSVMKAAAESIRYMLKPSSHADYALAQRYGGLDAAIAEMHRDLGQVHDSKTWKVMARKADKYAGIISDKSEQMAVAWSYFTANKLLKDIGITDEVIRASMSRQMVDESIANFSPLNRPQIFQSPGVGSALGLFQTYMFNYYGRLFGYIENRQYRTLAIQGAMQAAIFGTQTIPGMKQYTDMVFSGSAGQEDPIAGLYSRFSTPVADALFYGAPSTLGLLFGLDRDSVAAISSRGSVDVRVPGSANLPAGLNVMKNIITGVGDGIELFSRQNAGITDQQVGEVLQRHVMNRPMSAMISMFWTGALVDGDGNKIAEETSSALGGIWRAMGFRTTAQSAQIEAHARFRGAEALRIQRRAQLSQSMRSIFRGGDLNEAKLEKAMRAFVRTGGTPEEFVSFLRRSAESGLMTETERALTTQLANPDKLDSRMANILRLYNATHDTSIFDLEEEESTGE